MKKIGLILISTNKYKIFVKPLIESARNFFLNNHEVTYYLFTDSDEFNDLGDDVVINKIDRRLLHITGRIRMIFKNRSH